MATELGSAFISVGLGTNKLGAEIKQAFGASGDIGESAGKQAGSRFGSAVGLAAAAVGALGIGSFFKSAVSGAADLQQSVGAVDAVFKGSAGQIHEWASTAATDVGLTQNEFNELGTLIGSQLKNGGTAMEELAPKTKNLITLGSDLSSMFGGTTSEAVEALSSALKGERDPIERYGVSLNQAKIDAEAAALGFSKVGGSLSDEATQAATLSLIMKQTADAHGNFGRETDTLAHKQQVLNAQWANGKARIGAELLPAVAGLTGALSGLLGPAINGTVGAIRGMTQGFSDFYAGLTLAPGQVESIGAPLEGLVKIGAGIRGVFDPARIALMDFFAGITMNADTVASIGVPLEGMVAAGARVRQAFSDLWAGLTMPADVAAGIGLPLEGMVAVGASVRQAFDTVIGSFSGLLPILGQLIPPLFALFQALSPTSLIFQALVPVLPQIAAAIGSVIAQVVPLVVSLTSQLLPIITQLVATILPPLISIFSDVVTAIGPLVSVLLEALIPAIEALLPVVVTVFSFAADLIRNVMQAIQGTIQVVTGVITGDWSKVWTGIGNIFGAVWANIQTIVAGAIAIVGALITMGMSNVSRIVGGVLESIGRFFINAFNGMVSNTSGFIGNLVGMFASLPGRIMGALGGLAGMLVGVGRDMIQGLINGVGGMINNAVQAVRNVGGAMLDGIKGFLGIKSPSRVFKSQVGMMIGAGVIAGVDASKRGVDSSIRGLVSVPSVPSFRASSYVPAGAYGAGSGATFNTTINQVDDPIGTSHAVQRRLTALAV